VCGARVATRRVTERRESDSSSACEKRYEKIRKERDRERDREREREKQKASGWVQLSLLCRLASCPRGVISVNCGFMPDVTGCAGSSPPHVAESKSTPATSHNQQVPEFVDTRSHRFDAHKDNSGRGERRGSQKASRERVEVGGNKGKTCSVNRHRTRGSVLINS
jgi:hypothetical protein